MNSRCLTYLLCLFPIAARSQYQHTHTVMNWLGYYNSISFTEKLGMAFDAHLRSRDNFEKWYQVAFRSGVSYKMNDKWNLFGGLAFFDHAKYLGKDLSFRKEWRIFEEVSLLTKSGEQFFTQRLRTEERFLEFPDSPPSYRIALRLRYRFDLQGKLFLKGLTYLLGTEMMVNPVRPANYAFADQARSFAGISYKVSSSTTLQTQYMKAFQWKKSPDILENQDVIRLNIIQKFKFTSAQ